MTSVLDRVPVERIAAEARDVHVGRILLTMLALIPFAVGWIAGKVVLSIAWVGLSVKAGWIEARRTATDGDG